MLGNFSKKTIKMEDADPFQKSRGKKKEDKIQITQFKKKILRILLILITWKNCLRTSVKMTWTAKKN